MSRIGGAINEELDGEELLREIRQTREANPLRDFSSSLRHLDLLLCSCCEARSFPLPSCAHILAPAHIYWQPVAAADRLLPQTATMK